MILFPTIFLLASFVQSIFGKDINDNVDANNAGQIQLLHSPSSRSMLRKADGDADFATKRSYRDESIPLVSLPHRQAAYFLVLFYFLLQHIDLTTTFRCILMPADGGDYLRSRRTGPQKRLWGK